MHESYYWECTFDCHKEQCLLKVKIMIVIRKYPVILIIDIIDVGFWHQAISQLQIHNFHQLPTAFLQHVQSNITWIKRPNSIVINIHRLHYMNSNRQLPLNDICTCKISGEFISLLASASRNPLIRNGQYHHAPCSLFWHLNVCLTTHGHPHFKLSIFSI